MRTAEIEAIITKDMPELTGSAKQIAWAKDIRKNAAHLWSGVATMNARFMGIELESYIAALTAWLADKNEAKFWIDHRFSESSMLEEIENGMNA